MIELIENNLNLIGQGENSGLFYKTIKLDKKIDKSIGLECKETHLSDDDYTQGIEPEALLTSYLDYYQIFRDLGAKKTLIDLGAGYCRGSILAQFLDNKCVSIEALSQRVKKAREIGIENILNLDILDQNFKLPVGDAIFLYIPVGDLTHRIYQLILEHRFDGVLYAIESHGDLIDNLRCYPELFEEIQSELKVSTPRHRPHIYKFKIKGSHCNAYLAGKNLKAPKMLKWLPILKPQKNYHLKIKSKIANTLNDYREWMLTTSKLRMIFYNNFPAIQTFNPERIIQVELDDKVLEVY